MINYRLVRWLLTRVNEERVVGRGGTDANACGVGDSRVGDINAGTARGGSGAACAGAGTSTSTSTGRACAVVVAGGGTCFLVSVMLMLMVSSLATFVLTFTAFLVEGEGAVRTDACEDLLGACPVAGDEFLRGAYGETGGEGDRADDDVGHDVQR